MRVIGCMSDVTSPSGKRLYRGVVMRVDVTAVLACLLLAMLVLSAIATYGVQHRIDGVTQPVGPGTPLSPGAERSV